MSSAQEDNRKSDGESAPAATPAVPEPNNMEVDLVSGGNLDKIRTILFGAQSREFDRRFSRIEEAITRETADIREEMRGRFDKLEAHIKREFDTVGDRLKSEETERSAAVRDLTAQLKDTTRTLNDKIKSEHSERNDAFNELSTELRNTANAIDRRIGALDEQTARANRELRDQLAEQGKRLSDELRGKSEELWSALAKAVHELRNDKTDRTALAALLTEVAMRLNDEFKLPSGE